MYWDLLRVAVGFLHLYWGLIKLIRKEMPGRGTTRTQTWLLTHKHVLLTK